MFLYVSELKSLLEMFLYVNEIVEEENDNF